MKNFGTWFKSMTLGGKIITLLLIGGAIYGGKLGYEKIFPKEVKKATIVKTISIPPLPYDKDATTVLRTLPEFNELVDIDSKEIRGHIMGWNAQSGLCYMVGGRSTSQGSLAQEYGLNIKLEVQNSCTKQAEDLYAFAEELHAGNLNPSKGAHFTGWMGDGVPNYLAGLNDRLRKDFGEEYVAKVYCFGGASFGEDKWLLTPKYKKDPRGSVTVTVLRDGDWNICMKYAADNGYKVNHDPTTYDPEAINFISAPNDDYMEAAKFYISNQKVKLDIVRNGKRTGKDTLIGANGFSSWFPADFQGVKEKGGLVTVASTKEYGAQMANAIIFIDKWAQDNRQLMEKFIEALGEGGNQVKCHDQALKFACRVAQMVYADQNMTEDDWYNAYKSFPYTDEQGNEVEVGGSRVFNLADMAKYVGISGGSDKYKAVYETFGRICVESYPEILSNFDPYEKATDWSFLKAVYTKNKDKAGVASKADFKEGDKIKTTVSTKSVTIEFETGSAIIKESSKKMIESEIISQLLIADNLLVEISGHTDNTGNADANLILSEQRAKAVMELIVSKDRTEFSKRTTYKGYGQSKPIEDNSTVLGRSKNRRVEIRLGK